MNGFRMFDKPVDPDLLCANHCGENIVALGVDERYGDTFLWAHRNGQVVCRPTTKAQPFDAIVARKRVEAAEGAAIEWAEMLRDAAFGYVEVGA